MKRIFASFVMVGLTTLGFSQDGAWESNAALNYNLGNWKMNTSMGHRTVRTQIEESRSIQMAFTEINQFVTRKVSPKLKLSMGYKYRNLNNEDAAENRLTQQLAYTHQNSTVRLLSRFRAEQRFRTDFAHRYRYRFSLDFPLSGERLDNREFYLISSNEVLVESTGSGHSLDNRLSIGTGYVISNYCKIQFDFTQRFEDLNQELSQISFVTTSLIFTTP
ncbi:MAG: DUF2490 domain-containing protein [Ekhidna sp.]|nr:DUF2490 domain-containing protein [Ekhidna sp.]